MDLNLIKTYGISRTRRAWFTNPIRSLAWRLVLPYLQGLAGELDRRLEAEKKTPLDDQVMGGVHRTTHVQLDRMLFDSFEVEVLQSLVPLCRCVHSQRTLDVIQFLECIFTRFGTWPDFERIMQISYETFLQADHVILDVGANIGTHVEHFLRIAREGRVLAFEPLPDVFCSLIERFHPDGLRFSAYNLALSHSPVDFAPFVRADGSLAESGLRRREYNNPTAVQPSLISVRVDTLDNIVAAAKLQRVDYIKIDIEGGELDALRGASQTLSKFRPIVSVEYGPQAFTAYGYFQDSLFEFGEEIHYKIFDPFLQFIGTRWLWDAAKDRYCWDYFLVPEERTDQIKSPFFD